METEKGKLSSEQFQELFEILKARFEKNMVRHKEIEWEDLKRKLEANEEKLWSLLIAYKRLIKFHVLNLL